MIVVSLVLATLSSALGKPYSSSVYFEGPSLAPYEYVEYGPPKIELAPYSQVVSLPLPQVNSGPRLSPCVSPCGVETTLPLYQPQPKVTYSAPIQKIAVVPQPKQEPASYEYSYTVSDPASGDHKAAQERGAGGAGGGVRGRYALLQPDGYVREVLYTADDESGFKAVVKNFLPKNNQFELKVTPKNIATEKPKPPPVVKTKELSTESPRPKETSTEKLKESMEVDDAHTPSVEASVEITTDSSMEVEEHKRSPVVWSLDDIIRCAQAALPSGSEEQKTKKNNSKSALTYIVLPQLSGVNKPC